MDVPVYRVSQINNYVRRILSQVQLLNDVRISGEISNFKRHSSGHLYFVLKDEQAAVNAVMFVSDARTLRFLPENGSKVIARGNVTLYEKTGQYQFYVRQMEPDGQGALYQAFEALKQKLQEEGIFDPAHKKPIPRYPQKIALVTSPTGAAVQDMIQIARRRFPSIQLVLIPVLVQGNEAASSIAAGLQKADSIGADTVIVGRGGGSLEDLWAFNEEKVARAVYAMHTPVISAVGHETDFSITDFASDLRAPTPSAAAELAVPVLSDLLETIEQQHLTQQRMMHAAVDSYRRLLEQIMHMAVFQHPVHMLDGRRQMLSELGERLKEKRALWFSNARQCLKERQIQLEYSDPRRPLERGYTFVERLDGTILTAAAQTHAGESVRMHFKDGKVTAEIIETQIGEK